VRGGWCRAEPPFVGLSPQIAEEAQELQAAPTRVGERTAPSAQDRQLPGRRRTDSVRSH